MNSLLHKAFEGVANCGVKLLPVPRIVNLDNADEVALLGDDFQVVEVALNH